MIMTFEQINFCKKYRFPIEAGIEHLCSRWKQPNFKGCAGEKCPYLTVRSIRKESIYGKCIKEA